MIDAADGAIDQARDVARRIAGFFGQFAYFICHDGKTATVLPGAGRLDGGIEGQQIGLDRNIADRADDFMDVLRRFLDLQDGIDGLAQQYASLPGMLFRLLCDGVRMRGALADAVDGAGSAS